MDIVCNKLSSFVRIYVMSRIRRQQDIMRKQLILNTATMDHNMQSNVGYYYIIATILERAIHFYKKREKNI